MVLQVHYNSPVHFQKDMKLSSVNNGTKKTARNLYLTLECCSELFHFTLYLGIGFLFFAEIFIMMAPLVLPGISLLGNTRIAPTH